MYRKLLLFVSLSLSNIAQAGLINLGGGMIYDDVNNLTWLQDANYAKTSGYTTDGRMTWTEAKAWAEKLYYGGKHDWRLPTLIDVGNNGCDSMPVIFAVSGTDCGFNVNPSLSEFAYLYAINLGNHATDYNQTPSAFHSGPFVNVQTNQEAYWTNTAYAPSTDLAWMFFMNHGLQVWGAQTFRFHAWAVRSGKVATTISGYSVQPLPSLSPRLGSSRNDRYSGFDGLLNDHGHIAELSKEYLQPVIWSNGTLTDLGFSGYPANPAYPVDLNNLGQVALTADVETSAPESGSCYRWTPNPTGNNAGTLTNLGTLGGGCWVTAMNAVGQVTGISTVFDNNGAYRGNSVFLWSNGTMTNLDSFDNGAYSQEEPGTCIGNNYIYNSCPSATHNIAIDINDHGQVLFYRHDLASRLAPNPPAPGPVVWSNGVTIPLPQYVDFGRGKSINNRGDVLGYIDDKTFLIWNVNDGSTYRYANDVSGGALLTNLGEVYFPRADGIYKLTQDRSVQQVMRMGNLVCTTNQMTAVNDQGQIVGDCDGESYVNQNGIAAKLSSLVPSINSQSLGTVYAINEAGQILTSTALLTPVYQKPAVSCDVNQDNTVNKTDLSLIYAAKATAHPDYDIDGDGTVTVRDMRKCVVQCSNARCE